MRFQRRRQGRKSGIAASRAGFTLVELLVTLMILSVLAALAYPTFRTMSANMGVSDIANELVVSLNLARSEAVKRGVPVQVTAVDDNWNSGWVVQVGTGSDTEILRSHAALENGQAVNATDTEITFGSSGSLSGATSFGLRVCRPTALPDASEARLVTVRGSGMISSRRRGASDPTDPAPAAGCS